jgi:methylenetetrahydrofolate reductase (NADPH)
MVMRAKVAAGADFAITQMFFEAKTYIDYVKRMRKAGFKIPIVAGIRPITRPEHVEAAERLFHAKVPASLKRKIAGASKVKAREACVEYTVDLCRKVSAAGAPGVHLFILNDVELAGEIMGRVREATR